MAKRVARCRICALMLPVNHQYLCDECVEKERDTDASLNELIESRRATMPDALQPRRRSSTPGIRIVPDPRRRGK